MRKNFFYSLILIGDLYTMVNVVQGGAILFSKKINKLENKPDYKILKYLNVNSNKYNKNN